MAGLFTGNVFQIHSTVWICLLFNAMAVLPIGRGLFLYSVFGTKQDMPPIIEYNDGEKINRYIVSLNQHAID